MFLEVGIEAEYFSVVFEPGWLYARDRLVLGGRSGFLEGKVAERFGHFVDEIGVNVLFEELFFFLD